MKIGDSYDYVIVGAGTAGCVLAARLTEDPNTSVLLLEAGGPDRNRKIHVPAAFPKLFKTGHDWNYETQPQENLDGRRLYWPRGKVLGGSSSINAQIWLRGHPADYDAWAGDGAAGWGYGEVLPYFRRAESTERGAGPAVGSTGPLRVSEQRDANPLTRAFIQACKELGVPRTTDPNGRPGEGVDYCQVTQLNGRRLSTAGAYLKPARKRKNLTVVTGAHANFVTFHDTRAAGVVYTRQGKDQLAEARKEIVLASGAVNTPHLLMLSGVGPAAELQRLEIPVVRDLPGVGENLQDHLAVAVMVECREPITLANAESLKSLFQYLFFKRGMLTSCIAEAFALVTPPGSTLPDLELLFAPVTDMDHGFVKPEGHGMTVAPVLLQPGSRGRVTLRSTDPFDPPRIDPNYLADLRDVDILVYGVRKARQILKANPFKRWAGRPIDPDRAAKSDDEIEEFIRSRAETLYHPVGTCRMGTDDMAVVDPELRVRGIEGLRVADVSVMPRLNRGHTQAPAVMIGERAADFVRR